MHLVFEYYPSLQKTMITRRDFIRNGIWVTLPCVSVHDRLQHFLSASDYLMTVNGPISRMKAGFILPHEHTLVDFIGADQVNPARYVEDEVYDTVLPYLKQAYLYGARTFVDCTPQWLGRNVKLLQRLSDACGMHIITNTGYYGAAREKYLPPHAYTESAEQLAARWTTEWREGIGETPIRPGIIKTGVDNYPLSATQQKLIRAAALAHLETGLTIFVHTGDGKAALEQLTIIEDIGVKADAWVWTHAQNEADRAIHIQAAKAGGWIAFDGLYPQLTDRYLAFLIDMKKQHLLHRILLSHDAGWYQVGTPRGGVFRPYVSVFTDLIPALKKAQFTDNELTLLFKTNPANALAVKVRKV
ncbi:phosphotriesterase-related protein [Parapedobacter luteus]|uniref:Phosphotriesterase-related protein n=2 Tax=Parapedobacter luteus TaxID=623280 RepID=A0A1T5DNU9_9SPHI|nr:phosphotriesterase-related protein [Parapedobacter luteus]